MSLASGTAVQAKFPPGISAWLAPARRRHAFSNHEDQLRRLRRWLEPLLPGRPARDDVILVAVELGGPTMPDPTWSRIWWKIRWQSTVAGCAWFGFSTLQWWALPCRPDSNRLLTAPSAPALARLLDQRRHDT
ncbi:hypothetical protein [Sphaerimonospora thailandensis]|uniref:Uncharacterized protein n=1 Tax=Sphaerimonospora thailandensis TaxID=795644 RepID=A0A8J3VYC7_9ACTN|nr:hypothetical protein [Sphaerimonospora thailandensis]GIH69889.1 hypothetical protein Mth01_21420 [Sphaerimonospora thailandensis]